MTTRRTFFGHIFKGLLAGAAGATQVNTPNIPTPTNVSSLPMSAAELGLRARISKMRNEFGYQPPTNPEYVDWRIGLLKSISPSYRMYVARKRWRKQMSLVERLEEQLARLRPF